MKGMGGLGHCDFPISAEFLLIGLGLISWDQSHQWRALKLEAYTDANQKNQSELNNLETNEVCEGLCCILMH